MFLYNAWYVAAWGDELKQDLTSLRILGEKVCLYRNSAGDPIACADFCPHRRMPLSRGKLHGDLLECAYHGLTFDCSGQCVAAPTNDNRIPENARLRMYPCVERYGLIWIWMGDAAGANADGIFQVDYYGDPAWGYNRGAAIEVACNYEYINDNLLDPSHVAWVHSTTFGEESTRDTPMEVSINEDGVTVSRWMLNREPAPFYRDLVNFEGPCDRLQHYEVRYPSHALIRAIFTPAGTGGEDASLHADTFLMDSYNFMTPVDVGNTRYFWFQMRNLRPDDADLSCRMSEGVTKAFNEDREVLNALQQGMDEKPEGYISLRSDTGGFQFRRRLKKLIKTEQGAVN